MGPLEIAALSFLCVLAAIGVDELVERWLLRRLMRKNAPFDFSQADDCRKFLTLVAKHWSDKSVRETATLIHQHLTRKWSK
jgi:hypothetical protein